MAIFDSHLHLTRLPQPLEVARELHERGYRYRAIACEPWEWTAMRDLWEKASSKGWMEGCGLSFGLHPEIAVQVTEESVAGGTKDLWTELRRLLEAFPEAQVGEAGLDRRFAGYEPGGVQQTVFRRQAKMALEFGRDLQIHCVGDYGRIAALLRDVGFTSVRADVKCAQSDAGVKQPRPVFHRFGGDAGIVKAGLSLGALFSIHVDSLRKKATREALALIPAEAMQFETDADETFVTDANETPQQVADRLVETLSGVLNGPPSR